MGFWSFLFGKSVRTGDYFFGEMQFIGTVNSLAQSYFECQRYFKPIGEPIELNVTGTLAGPNQRQRDFFTWVEREYMTLVPKLVPLLEQEFGAWMPQPIIKDFYAEFKPTFLDIPTCDQQPIEWEIVFDTVHDLNHIVTVGMLGAEPQYVRIDG